MFLAEYSRDAASAKRQRQRLKKLGTTCQGHPLWTEREDDECRRLYPDYAALQKALPHRTRAALKSRCRDLGITRKLRLWNGQKEAAFRKLYRTGGLEELLASFPDCTPHQLHARAATRGLRRPKLAYKATGNPLLDELRRECFRQLITMPDLDEFANSGRYFRGRQWRGPRGSINYRAIARAVEALGGILKIEWRAE